MRKDIAERWVAALRSGVYPQTTGHLRDKANGVDSYCCLGVLCDLHSKSCPTGSWDGVGYCTKVRGKQRYNTEFDVPTAEVVRWAELSEANPTMTGGTIAELNDNAGKTFDELADLIEASWESM